MNEFLILPYWIKDRFTEMFKKIGLLSYSADYRGMLKYLVKLIYVNINIWLINMFRFSPSPYSQGKEKYTDWSPTGHPEPSIRNTNIIKQSINHYLFDWYIILQKKRFSFELREFQWVLVIEYLTIGQAPIYDYTM